MKIQSSDRVHRSQTVKFAKGIKVTFDSTGVAEVSKPEGDFLLESYSGFLFEQGKPIVSSPKVASSTKDSTLVEDFKERILELNRVIQGLKMETNQAKESEGVWRRKCDELIAELDLLKKNSLDSEDINPDKADPTKTAPIETGSAPETKTGSESITSDELRKSLSVKKKGELTEIAISLSLPKEEWEQLNQVKLVDYLVSKATNV